jgi:DNA-directed RNA polymerase specialized sigma24 family protein/CheY-like chemotaxis protein
MRTKQQENDMSLSDTIAPHLPYLRRYARALTGSQQSGDAYVVAVLEALVADPGTFKNDLHPRVAIYQALTKIWNSLQVNGEQDRVDTLSELPFDRRIEGLTPKPRQAFLLVAVEGFTPAQAAEVLDIDADELTALLNTAGAEIADQITADILIIEDEPLIAMDLEGIVGDLGHHVQGIARTHREAVSAVQQKKPDLVLADIQLADGSSGLEAVHEILGSIQVPVIFITAYPERLLTGDRPEPVFLITKPFQPNMVKALISQALFFEYRARRRQAA